MVAIDPWVSEVIPLLVSQIRNIIYPKIHAKIEASNLDNLASQEMIMT